MALPRRREKCRRWYRVTVVDKGRAVTSPRNRMASWVNGSFDGAGLGSFSETELVGSPGVGGWEIAVGVGLLVPVALRLTLLLFWAQMAGTFLVLVIHPDLSFQGQSPLLLTLTGEFVIKNLVLITAGLVIGSTVARKRRDNSL